MNRKQRRKEARDQKKPFERLPGVNLPDTQVMTPAQKAAMNYEIDKQILEREEQISLDVDVMVLWTLFQCYGWRKKRLHDFYFKMVKEHKRMREYFQMRDVYPERKYLKDKGIDVEEWQKEALEYYDKGDVK